MRDPVTKQNFNSQTAIYSQCNVVKVYCTPGCYAM